MGRWSYAFYDPLRRVVGTVDPLGRTTTLKWCSCGSLEEVIDPSGNVTTWERDIQGRVTKEIRANGSEMLSVYENTTSRLKRRTDAEVQHTDFTYYLDDKLHEILYVNPENPTPDVSFTYDASYNRRSTMIDGNGTTTYSYHPVGALGAGWLASIDGPASNDTISYSYDELGRVRTRSINGIQLAASYDALGRAVSETSQLGGFTFDYEGITNRLKTVAYPNGQTANYSYYSSSGDHRVQEIHHKKSGGTTISKFNYSYDSVGSIKTWTQQQDSSPAKAYDFEYDRAGQVRTAVWRTTDPTPTILKRYAYIYDPAGNRSVEQVDNAPVLAAYDNMNRLTSHVPGGIMRFSGALNEAATVTVRSVSATVSADNKFETGAQVSSGTNQVIVKAKDYAGNERTNTYEVSVSGSTKTFTFDSNGNLTGDGTRTFEWDAEDRLIAVNQGTLRSEFVYDGEGRRVQIVEKSSGVVTSDRRFLWCGTEICEERDASSAVTKRFYRFGIQEGVNAFFYTFDHLGSIREMTDTSGTVRARYDYDPYGRRTFVSGDKEVPFGFTGHYVHSPSGLVLAPYRAYDPALGRWIAEDPIGVAGGFNLYNYVRNGPLAAIDPLGLDAVTDDPNVRRCLCELWRDSMYGNDNRERAAWVINNGGTRNCIRWPWSAQNRQEQWEGPPPPNAEAIVHTHPTSGVDPKPGGGDQDASDQTGLPNYVCSRSGIWKAKPNCEGPKGKCPPEKVAGPEWKDWCKK